MDALPVAPEGGATKIGDERFRSAVASASLGAFSWDAGSRTLLGTEIALSLFDLPQNEPVRFRRLVAAVDRRDRVALVRAVRRAVVQSAELVHEFRAIAQDGSVRWVVARGRAHRDAGDSALRFEGVIFDVTRHRSIDRSRETNRGATGDAALARAVEHSPAILAILDRDMRYLAVSRRWLAAWRIEDAEPLVGRSHYDVFPEIPERWKEIHRRCLGGAVERCEEDAFPRLDGTVDWLSWEISPWRTEAGEIGGIVIVVELITDRKRAEEQHRISEERLRLAIAGGSLGTWHWDFRTSELVWSEMTYTMFGIAPGTAMDFEKFFVTVHPDDRATVQTNVERALADRTDYYAEFRVCLPSGGLRWLACRGRPYYDAAGTPSRMEGVALDITPHKQVEQALREGEARFRDLAEALPHLVWKLDPRGEVIYENGRCGEYFGRSGWLGIANWNDIVHPDDLARVTAAFDEMVQRDHSIAPFRLRRGDGTYRWFVARTVPVCDRAGNLVHVVGTASDVDHVRKTEDALRVSRARLDTALRVAGMGTWVWDIDRDHVEIDDALGELLGIADDDRRRASLETLLDRLHPDDRETARLAFARARRESGEFEIESRVRRSDALLWVASKGRVEKESGSRFGRLYGASVDITHRKRLEEELRQAQKMEAIGQLAGGVAHDFNNLLTAILGQSSAVLERPDLPDGVGDAIREIATAAERAASLTAQLLAFGRRQTMQSRDFAIDRLIGEVGTMLRRLLGEDIALELESSDADLFVSGDANMLAQVLLNLAVNARDAMPRGGRLGIHTGIERIDERAAEAIPDAIPGTWVCVSVSDTGAGIAPDVLPRIFEPFFTTKDVGRGTGLGLATVYGIVKQHRGWVSVETTVGRGTTFKTYLPLVRDAMPVVDEPTDPPKRGRGEMVLLVEDESIVRTAVKRMLEEHGYRLIVANDGHEALEAFRAHGAAIDLLLTDVVMPRGMSGIELVTLLGAEKPGLKWILCSGYNAETVGRDMTAETGAAFLQKPYRPEELFALVRRVLDS